MPIRRAAVANQFYPGDKFLLKQAVMEYLERAEIVPEGVPSKRDDESTKGHFVPSRQPPQTGPLKGKVKAIIAPHAGYIYSGPVAGYAYKYLKKMDQEVMAPPPAIAQKEWKVVLMGPSHYVPFIGAAAATEDKWETVLGTVEVKDIRKELSAGKNFVSENIVDVPEANIKEHSLEVQVPFLQLSLKKFVLYPLVLGSVRPDFLADELVDFAKKEDVVFVASSDLSHFLEYEEAKKIDLGTSEAITNLDIDRMIETGDACGRTGILVLMFLAQKLEWKCKMVQYMNSGDTAGDKSSVVGYGAYIFYQ